MPKQYYDNPVSRVEPQKVQHTHDGKLVLGVDPIRAGAENYITLQNYRYDREAGIIGVSGNSKINTTAITDYTNIRDGIQLRTDRTTKSRVLVHAEHSSYPSSNNSRVYENTTAIPSQGDFSATVIHTDASPNLVGRFSNAPAGDIFYCNGEETCQYAGDEMRVAGFFTASEVTITNTDFVFAASTCTTTAGNFLERGFRAGQTVTIVGGANDGNTRIISAISATGKQLTFTVAPSAETLGTEQTIYVDSKSEYNNPVDYTEAINNELQTSGNVIDTFGGNDSYTKLLIHADTSIADASPVGRTLTPVGGAVVSEEAAKWGVGSLKLDGDGDYVTAADSADWDFSTGELCIDAWVWFDAVSALHTIYFQSNGAGDYDHVWLYYDSIRDLIVFEVVSSGAVLIHETASWIPNDTWYHIAVIRGWGGDADDWAITSSGTAIHTFTASVTMPNLTGTARIGGGASGATLDYSGQDHPIRFDATAQISSTYKWVSGGLLLDGNSDRVAMPDSSDWDIFGDNTNSYTVDFWVKHTDHAGTEGYFSHFVDADNEIRFSHVDGSGLTIVAEVATSNVISIAGAGEITDTDWHHIALVVVGSGATKDIGIYLDGVQTGYVQDNSTPTMAGNFIIGWTRGTGDQWLDGSIDEFRVQHSNPFSAAPVVGLTDTITVPTSAHTADANTKLLLHFDVSDFDGYMDEVRISKGIPRWTANFSAPDRAYKEAQKRWYAFSTRPLSGGKFYISNANTEASTLAGYCWTGRGFSELSITDGTTSGGISAAQTGFVTFGSTVDSAKPWHFEGLYLYAYLFELSTGGTEIYHMSLKAPFQSVVDVWDGVYRQPITCQFYRSSDGYYKDYSLEVNESSYAESPIGLVLDQMGTSDHGIIAFEERVSAVNLSMLPGLVNTNAANLVFYYWGGLDWFGVGDLKDTTTHQRAIKTISQTGTVSWSPPAESDEALKTEFGVTGYFYKFEVSATLSGTAGGDAEIVVDVITGVPAQGTVPPFKFASRFHNRPLICCFEKGKEGNRVDFGVSNTTNVWNGTESSMFGVQSLYFGGNDEDLTCGVQIYNRFGSSLFTTWVGIKEGETYLLNGTGPDDFTVYTISESVGCPAPGTLDTAEMGFKLTEEAHRNIAMWLSYQGPVLFDGATIVPMMGMEVFFDETKDEYIKKSLFSTSIGCYDPARAEMNFIFPSGASATKLNKWIVYNFAKRKIFEKVPKEYPQTLLDVLDTDGIRYVYGTIDSGFLVRIDNGTTWADGTAITRVWETGDFVLGDTWHKSVINRMMFANKKTTEDLDISVLHYPDTVSSVAYAGSDISFSGSTVSTAAGNFLTTLSAGQSITISGSVSNNVTKIIDSIATNGQSFTITSGTFTAESAGASVTMTVNSDLTIPINSGDGRVSLTIEKTKMEGWSHRIKQTVTDGTGVGADEGQINPLFWAIEWQDKGPFETL